MSNNDTSETKTLDVLLKVHEELINQIIYEGNVHWNLTYFFVVITLGLISGTIVLFSINRYLTTLFCVSGAVVSFVWYHLLKRSEVYALTRVNKVIKLEKELQKKGLPLDTWSSTSLLVKQGEFIDWDGKTKPLSRSQQFSHTKVVRRGTLIMTIIWLGATLFLLSSFLSGFLINSCVQIP